MRNPILDKIEHESIKAKVSHTTIKEVVALSPYWKTYIQIKICLNMKRFLEKLRDEINSDQDITAGAKNIRANLLKKLQTI